MSRPAPRLFTLLLLLQRQPNQKAAALAAALGVSVRTIHRYLSMLEEMGIPIYSERGPEGGFSLLRGYKMPPLMLDAQEATAIYLGLGLVERLWGRLYHDAAHGALAKLDHILPEVQREEAAWAQQALIVAGLHRADAQQFMPVLEVLRAALREQRRVRFTYRSGQLVEREVSPYALAYRTGWWYLIGFCHLRQALRFFRLDRMGAVQRLSMAVLAPPPDFEPNSFLATAMQGQEPVQVTMRFAASAAGLALYQQASWKSCEQEADGSVVVRFGAADWNWAASMVLAYGPWVEVLDPPEVRRLVCDWLKELVERYATEER